MFTSILFYAFGALLVIAALGVITARNPVHCALFLVFAFLNSARDLAAARGRVPRRHRCSSSTWAR